MTFISVNADAKTIKGKALNVLTGIMYLAPASLSGTDVCPFATAACRASCLNTAGRGAFSSVQNARINRTKRFLSDRVLAIKDIKKEIVSLVRKATKAGMVPAIRLNGTSDLAMETLFPMTEFQGVQFYDYTKNPHRMKKYLAGEMPSNYHLTFSLSETNKAQALDILRAGGNVAAVFRTTDPKHFPKTWEGFKVINGDETDVRFYDPKGVVVGLKMKGKASKDSKGFVQPV